MAGCCMMAGGGGAASHDRWLDGWAHRRCCCMRRRRRRRPADRGSMLVPLFQRQLVQVFALSIAAVVVSAGSTKQQPHILFILADDYGWNDIGYHANHSAEGYYNSANPTNAQTTTVAAGMMRTPTLDRLAAEGCKLESYYVQPLCSPTRGTIMTGRYPSHTGIGPDVLVENVPYGMPAREKFLPEYLREAGYKTHAIGKVRLSIHTATCCANFGSSAAGSGIWENVTIAIWPPIVASIATWGTWMARMAIGTTVVTTVIRPAYRTRRGKPRHVLPVLRWTGFILLRSKRQRLSVLRQVIQKGSRCSFTWRSTAFTAQMKTHFRL